MWQIEKYDRGDVSFATVEKIVLLITDRGRHDIWLAGYGVDIPDDFDYRSTEDVGKAGFECGSDHRQLCAE